MEVVPLTDHTKSLKANFFFLILEVNYTQMSTNFKIRSKIMNSEFILLQSYLYYSVLDQILRKLESSREAGNSNVKFMLRKKV